MGTDYNARLSEIKRITRKGFLISSIIALVLSILLIFFEKNENFFAGILHFIGIFLLFCIPFGIVLSLFFYIKSNSNDFLANAFQRVIQGFWGIVLASFAGGPLLWIVAILIFLIGLAVMIPLLVFFSVCYFLNLIYYPIMSALENKGTLVGKESLCEKIDIGVYVLAGIITAPCCIELVKLSIGM